MDKTTSIKNSPKKAEILIVDDTPDNLRLLSRLLTNQGYDVRQALNGRLALKSAKHHVPDLILLDIRMPGMDGFMVCENLKEDDQTKEIPVIFISALDDIQDKIKAFQVGGVDYITKPFHYEEVSARVKTHISLQHVRKQLEKHLVQRSNQLILKNGQLKSQIKEKQEVSQALSLSEKKYQEIFNSTSEAILLYDVKTWSILEANQAIIEMCGYSKEELLNMEVGDLIFHTSPYNREKFLHLLSQTINAKLQAFEWMVKKKDGTHLWAELTIKSSTIDGKDVMVLVARNISHRKQAEKDLARLENQLRQTQKMEAIGTLAGGIAHDFNNILFPIIGHTEMLLDDIPTDSPFRDDLDNIYTGALRARDLVKQILTFSRQENSEQKLIKIEPVINEALKLIRSSIPTTIEIKQEIDTDCGVIKADPTQIHQIIMNLTANAYHAMENDGGELKVSLKKIELDEHQILSPDMAPGVYDCLTIADTGIGMDKETIVKIFDPFFTTKEKGKGTGMGLSVVHGIVSGIGGAILVYSEPGRGTEFKVYFPIGESYSEKQDIQNKGMIHGGSERILLVDDEENIIEMEKRILERLGYKVTSFTNSIKALEAFRRAPEKFDMVITDMAMPYISGDRLSPELVKIRPDIPILLCTGFSETMSENSAASIGIKGFLMKPIVTKDLAEKIREVLGDR